MAKRVVWSRRAQSDRKQILDYWRNRTKSNSYSVKLNELFKESVKIIIDFPQIGKPTDIGDARIKIVKDYLIIYEETEKQILILTIWDSRQNPEEFKKVVTS